MARRLRLFVPNTPCHIVQRGNNKNQIFFYSDDYQTFLEILQESLKKHACLLYSFCLMLNHFHLIVNPGETGNISLFMKLLGGKYVRYLNKKYNRTGTLWESRFRSFLIGDEQYFIRCLRYVELNPVRSNIVSSPELYHWSSYRFKIGAERNSPFIEFDPWYTSLDTAPIKRQLKYHQFFQESLTKQELNQIHEIVNRGCVYGNEEFIKFVEGLAKKDLLIKSPGRPIKIIEMGVGSIDPTPI
jgi:putative transposase